MRCWQAASAPLRAQNLVSLAKEALRYRSSFKRSWVTLGKPES